MAALGIETVPTFLLLNPPSRRDIGQHTAHLPNYVVELLKARRRIIGFDELRMRNQSPNMRSKTYNGIESAIRSMPSWADIRMIQVVQVHSEIGLEIATQARTISVHQ